MLTRRSALLGLGTAVSLGRASLAWAYADTQSRLVVVLLRGALDGLSAVQPYGDGNLASLRGALALAPPGQPGGLLDLGGFYGLHPSLAGLHTLYAANQLLICHAVAGDWRSRSHFEAQDFLESGVDRRMTSGWLNRVVAALPGGNSGHGTAARAIAVGDSVPLLLRGPADVASWLPNALPEPDAAVYAKVVALNAQDRITGPALAQGLRERGFSDAVLAGLAAPPDRNAFATLAGEAGRLLAAPGGPRVAALEIVGLDTHQAQMEHLPMPLAQLDAGLMALQQTLGEAWRHTAVLVMTEFGRTVRVNGTRGTDHGTATVAFALGGAVAGGRVRANWPGLSGGQLFENRDLAPTSDLRAFAKGLVGPHMGLDAATLARVFPGSEGVSAMQGLVQA
jgi:uncharacterized protein (DUF1501 family)